MLSAMRDAEIYGLRPADYAVRISAADLQAVRGGRADASTRQRFESELSRAAARFVTHVHSGRIDPASAGLSLPRARRSFDATSALQQLASSPDFPTTLASLEPAPLPYRRLKEALAHYRSLAQQASLTSLPPLPGRSLAQGAEYAGAPALRRLLEVLGDLTATSTTARRDEQTIDAALVSGIRSFQRRHGLAIDGVLGSRTFATLTQPLEQRVLQLELAMERWRWLTSIERPDIVVNIPQFMLFALPRADQPSSSVLEMQVIVGQSYPHTRTPMFVSAITHVVFQPYWDVPAGILKRELLPRIRKDPSFLDRYHMEIVRGQGDDARVVTPSAARAGRACGGSAAVASATGPRQCPRPGEVHDAEPVQRVPACDSGASIVRAITTHVQSRLHSREQARRARRLCPARRSRRLGRSGNRGCPVRHHHASRRSRQAGTGGRVLQHGGRHAVRRRAVLRGCLRLRPEIAELAERTLKPSTSRRAHAADGRGRANRRATACACLC